MAAARKKSSSAPAAPSAKAPVKFHFVFPSSYARMREVQKALVDEIEARRYDEESQFAIKLSLEEGLINAIKHGNKLDPARNVTVDAEISNHLFTIRIQDQGSGFKRADVPDPTDEANLDKPSGRGLLLMEAYMTSVAYSDGGRVLSMTRKAKSGVVE